MNMDYLLALGATAAILELFFWIIVGVGVHKYRKSKSYINQHQNKGGEE